MTYTETYEPFRNAAVIEYADVFGRMKSLTQRFLGMVWLTTREASDGLGTGTIAYLLRNRLRLERIRLEVWTEIFLHLGARSHLRLSEGQVFKQDTVMHVFLLPKKR